MAYYARLSFNANGGSGAPSPQIAFTDTPNTSTSITIPSTVPTRQYYTFMGWNVNSSAPSGYAAGSSYPVRTSDTADLANARQYTTYATWKRKTIVVTYNANGGSNAPTSQTVNMYEWFTLRSGVPTRQYYDFLGWATSASATTAQYQPSASARFTSNVTLYAVWKKAADVVSTSNGTMGSAMTLTITKADASYKDTITYQFGSATGTIVSGTTLTTISWTPPTTLAAQIPNASSGSLVLTCKTYNGGTLVGTTTKTVTLSVPQSLAPTASVTIADNDATCLSWGVYVQSRSTLTFTISATGQESATISSYRTTVNGTQYTSASFTTDVLLYNGSNSYTIIVTDSRGLQTTVTGTFNVEAYAVPSVTLVSCDRNDSDAEQVDVTFDFTVASVSNNNSAQYALDYKKKTSITWTTGTAVSCGGYYGTISDSLSGIDQGDEYDIRVRVIDAFAEASVETEVGASGNIMLHSRHIGGAGLLMKSQAENQLDVGKQTIFHARNLAQYGSTVGRHDTSGSYAKVMTFGTNITVSANKLPPMVDGTYEGNGVKAIVSGGVATLSGTTTASGNAIIIPLSESVVVPNDSYFHLFNSDANGSASPSFELSTSAGTTNIAPSFNPANRIYAVPSNRFGVTIDRVRFWLSSGVTLSGTFNPMLCMSSTAIPFEPYVAASNLNVDAPITLEYAKTGDVTPVTLTINFNRDYSLNSFTKNASADAYLFNSSAATWELYIGKANSSDSVEILDFHNSWGNSDITVTWNNTTVNTLPTGYVSATPVNTVITESPSGVSVSSGSWKTVASITFPRGIWLLSGYVQFNSNSTGIRSTVLSATQDDSTSTRAMSSDLNNNTGNNSGKLHFVDIYQIASTTTYYLNAYQNSGSAITTYGRLTAIKIV